MAFGAVGSAGVGHLGYEIAEIAGVANGRLDTLIGNDPADHQLPYPEVAENIVDVSRNEHAGRGLRQPDLVGCRSELIDDPAVPGALWHVEAGDLVVETAVTTNRSEAFDGRVHHFDAPLAECFLEPLHVRNDLASHLLEEPPVAFSERMVRKTLEFASFAAGREVLHVDEQERARRRNQRNLTAEDLWLALNGHHDSPSKRVSQRSGRACKARCPRWSGARARIRWR